MADYEEIMLTTSDNPYNPFDQFEQWLLFDTEKGYNTCAILAEFAHTSDELSEKDNMDEIERAIDEIIKYDYTKNYIKVKRKA